MSRLTAKNSNDRVPANVDEIYDKLTELEDLMEKYHCNDIVDLENMLQENTELKKQLEENYNLRYELAGANETIEVLKQQLAEKNNTIENWQMMYESVVHTCHNDKEEIERLNKELAKKDLKIIELETKLNLKDKETNV
jgi:predicted RNase H-like nuclease (RuvC/YqgF family)